MSLLSALLEDALYDPPIIAQDVFFAVRSDSAPGAGTADNPYRANEAVDFDALMNDAAKTPENTTIHLGPGTFKTSGYAPSNTHKWSPRSGQRIVGAGMGVTTLKLTSHTANEITHAIGMDLTGSEFLQSFELSDLTIDANVTGSTGNLCGGAVSITGRDIYIRRVRVKNFGSSKANTSFSVILAGKARAVYSYEVQNNVIEDCIFQSPGYFNTGVKAKLLCFEGEVVSTVVYSSKSCVIRNCDVDAGSLANPIVAISPGIGLGTIIEQNQIYNCQTGVELANEAAQDLVIWDNLFHNVTTGFTFTNTTSEQVKRLVLLGNIINLEHSSSAKGIVVSGSSTEQNFRQIVARKNIIRDVTFPAGNTVDMIGLTLANIQDAIVEDNIINNCGTDKALQYDPANVQSMKSFNNQSTASTLMCAYKIPSGPYLQELADSAQDSLLTV